MHGLTQAEIDSVAGHHAADPLGVRAGETLPRCKGRPYRPEVNHPDGPAYLRVPLAVADRMLAMIDLARGRGAIEALLPIPTTFAEHFELVSGAAKDRRAVNQVARSTVPMKPRFGVQRQSYDQTRRRRADGSACGSGPMLVLVNDTELLDFLTFTSFMHHVELTERSLVERTSQAFIDHSTVLSTYNRTIEKLTALASLHLDWDRHKRNESDGSWSVRRQWVATRLTDGADMAASYFAKCDRYPFRMPKRLGAIIAADYAEHARIGTWVKMQLAPAFGEGAIARNAPAVGPMLEAPRAVIEVLYDRAKAEALPKTPGRSAGQSETKASADVAAGRATKVAWWKLLDEIERATRACSYSANTGEPLRAPDRRKRALSVAETFARATGTKLTRRRRGTVPEGALPAADADATAAGRPPRKPKILAMPEWEPDEEIVRGQFEMHGAVTGRFGKEG